MEISATSFPSGDNTVTQLWQYIVGIRRLNNNATQNTSVKRLFWFKFGTFSICGCVYSVTKTGCNGAAIYPIRIAEQRWMCIYVRKTQDWGKYLIRDMVVSGWGKGLTRWCMYVDEFTYWILSTTTGRGSCKIWKLMQGTNKRNHRKTRCPQSA